MKAKAGILTASNIVLPVFLFVLFAIPAFAQEAEMPGAPPHKESVKLGMLLGTWKGSGAQHIMQDTIPVSLTFKIEKTADGFGLLGQMTGKMGKSGTYRETQLMGYDKSTGEVRVFVVTNTGQIKHYTGTWSGDETNTLKLSYIYGEVGKEYKETMTVIFGSEGQLILANLATVNGKYHSSLEATLRK